MERADISVIIDQVNTALNHVMQISSKKKSIASHAAAISSLEKAIQLLGKEYLRGR